MPLPDLAQLLPLVALLVPIGALAGVIAGLLGVGGGIVLVPAFLYTFQALGYDGPQIMQVCLATSLATIVFTSQRSVRAHAEEGRRRLGHPARLGRRASPSAPCSACWWRAA